MVYAHYVQNNRVQYGHPERLYKEASSILYYTAEVSTR